MKHHIRLVAIDLDDTLLRHDLSLSADNKAAILAARQAGVRVVLASGRNIHSMRRYALELGMNAEDDVMICSNGAEILGVKKGNVLRENKMSPQLCRDASALAQSFGLSWQIYHEGRILVSEKNAWTNRDSELTGQPNELIGDPEPHFLRGTLKMVMPGEPEIVARAYESLKRELADRANVTLSKPYFLEVLDPQSNKGAALQWLAGSLGLLREEVMAIGDSLNDVEMVAWAGLGCAVGNALPELKAAARLVSELHHEDEAVAWLLGRAGILETARFSPLSG